jgi:glutamate racemase
VLVKVAVLDWGIGGVTCAQGLRARCPNLDIVYLSDSGHTPYGLLPRGRLAERVRWLIERGDADLTLVACNAASSVLDTLDSTAEVEGLVDFALDLALETQAGSIGVLAGQRVVTDQIYSGPLRAAGRVVIDSCGQPLSALVERGELSGSGVTQAVAQCVAPLTGVSAVLLGCTHYAALTEVLSAALPHALWLDPVPRMLDRVTERYGLATVQGRGTLSAFTSGSYDEMSRAAASVYGYTMPPNPLGPRP